MLDFFNDTMFQKTDKQYSVTLSDGTVLDGLSVNGNNFISDVEISSDIFENNLDKVVISDGENNYKYTDMVLVSNRIDKMDGKDWFILDVKTEEEKAKEKETRERLETEQLITEMDIQNIETQQQITDMDLRLIELEVKQNER